MGLWLNVVMALCGEFILAFLPTLPITLKSKIFHNLSGKHSPIMVNVQGLVGHRARQWVVSMPALPCTKRQDTQTGAPGR